MTRLPQPKKYTTVHLYAALDRQQIANHKGKKKYLGISLAEGQVLCQGMIGSSCQADAAIQCKLDFDISVLVFPNSNLNVPQCIYSGRHWTPQNMAL